MKSCCIAAITWVESGGRLDHNSLRTAKFAPTTGHECWTRYVAPLWGSARFEIVGQDVYQFLGQFDLAIIQHFQHPDFLLRMRNEYPGTKILVWTSVEAIPTSGWPYQPAFYEALKDYRLVSSTHNRFGDHFVDQYEADQAPYDTKPHDWLIDIRGSYGSTFATLLFAEMQRRLGLTSGFLLDSMGDYQFFHTASNADEFKSDPGYTLDYQAGWNTVISEVVRLFPRAIVYGNKEVGGLYRARAWAEHWFRNDRAVERGMIVGCSADTIGQWNTPAGREDLRGLDVALDGDVYVQFARTGMHIWGL